MEMRHQVDMNINLKVTPNYANVAKCVQSP